jgi:hypothetical protein
MHRKSQRRMIFAVAMGGIVDRIRSLKEAKVD